jgi:hypothetical protein
LLLLFGNPRETPFGYTRECQIISTSNAGRPDLNGKRVNWSARWRKAGNWS